MNKEDNQTEEITFKFDCAFFLAPSLCLKRSQPGETNALTWEHDEKRVLLQMNNPAKLKN